MTTLFSVREEYLSIFPLLRAGQFLRITNKKLRVEIAKSNKRFNWGTARSLKAIEKSDHFMVLGDGRADHMGKGVANIRSSQRQLAPDNTEPTFLAGIIRDRGCG